MRTNDKQDGPGRAVLVLTGENIGAYAALLPDWVRRDILKGRRIGFGCADFSGGIERRADEEKAGKGTATELGEWSAAGVLVGALSGETMEICWLYVHPAHRRRRVASALLEELLRRCIRWGAVEKVCCEYAPWGCEDDGEGLRCFFDSFVFQTMTVPSAIHTFLADQIEIPAKAAEQLEREQVAARLLHLANLSVGQRMLAGKQLAKQGILLQEGAVDWGVYDENLSFVWMEQGKLLGLLLMRQEKEELVLTDLYAAPQASQIIILLLAKMKEQIRACGGAGRVVRVITVTERAEALLGRLVPSARRRMVYRSELVDLY